GPVLRVSAEHRLVSHHRPARASSAPLRAGGAPAAEAPQARGILGTVWPSTPRGHASVCHSSLSPPGHRLCPPHHVSPTAEAADPARPPDDRAAHYGPAAPAVYHGRPALGRSDHA